MARSGGVFMNNDSSDMGKNVGQYFKWSKVIGIVWNYCSYLLAESGRSILEIDNVGKLVKMSKVIRNSLTDLSSFPPPKS